MFFIRRDALSKVGTAGYLYILRGKYLKVLLPQQGNNSIYLFYQDSPSAITSGLIHHGVFHRT